MGGIGNHPSEILSASQRGGRRPDTDRFRWVVATLAARLVDISSEHDSHPIAEALETLGRGLRAERASLFARIEESDHFESTHHWTAARGAGDPLCGALRDDPSGRRFPWLAKRLEKLETVVVARTADLPEVARSERARWLETGAASVAFAPLVSRGVLTGFLCVERLRGSSVWSFEERTLLRVVADMLVGLLERSRMAAELQCSQEMLRSRQRLETVGRLAGSIAHDFNNVLTAIIGYSELLEIDLDEAHFDDDASARDGVREIRRAADHASVLIDQILGHSRPGSIEPRLLDPNGAVGELETLIRRSVGDSVEFVLDLGDDVPDVRILPGSIGQILINLAVNARDAMGGCGTFRIETRGVEVERDGRCAGSGCGPTKGLRPGRYALIRVRDDGCGLDEETRLRAFEPFFTTKSRRRGCGLGLATVAARVNECGGRIEAQSAPGAGTCFCVYLPAATGEAACDTPAARRDAKRHLSRGGGTILVAEPDELVRSFMRRVLEGYGYQVLEAEDAETTLRLCRDHPGPLDLIVSDVEVRRRSGVALADEIRSLRPGLRVLFSSSDPERVRLEQGDAAGEAPILEKPFGVRELAGQVQRVLDADPD